MTTARDMRRKLRLIQDRLRRGRTLREALHSSTGAIDLASIMVGVLVIGIIAGVIAATVIAVVPWSQDNAAKQNLDGVRTAESVTRVQDGAFTDYAGLVAAKRIQTSKTVTAGTDVNGTCYLGLSASPTGHTYWSSDKTNAVNHYVKGTSETDPAWCATKTPVADLLSPIQAGAGGSYAAAGTGAGGAGSSTPADYGTGWSATPVMFANSWSPDGNTAYLDVYKADGSMSTAVNTTNWTNQGVTGNQGNTVSGTMLNGNFYFPTKSSNGNTGISVYDGTSVSLATDPNDYISVNSMVTFDGKIYFSGYDTNAAFGGTQGLYSFDGKTISLFDAAGSAGTPGPNSPSTLPVLNGVLYYLTGTSSVTAFDGTTRTVISSPDALSTSPFVVGNGIDWIGGLDVYRYTGSGAPASVYHGSAASSYFGKFSIAGGKLYVDAGTRDASSGVENWVKIDGATVTSAPGQPFDMGSKMYILTDWGSTFSEWDGTNIVKTYAMPAGVTYYGSGPYPSGANTAGIFFEGYDSTHGQEPWLFDGTNFTRLGDYTPGSGDSQMVWTGSLGSTEFFDNTGADASGHDGIFAYTGAASIVRSTDHIWPTLAGYDRP